MAVDEAFDEPEDETIKGIQRKLNKTCSYYHGFKIPVHGSTHYLGGVYFSHSEPIVPSAGLSLYDLYLRIVSAACRLR